MKLSTVPPVASLEDPKNLLEICHAWINGTQVTLAGRVPTRFGYTLVMVIESTPATPKTERCRRFGLASAMHASLIHLIAVFYL
jgi:hypothetical protein